MCTVFSTTQGRYLYSEKLRLLADYGNSQKETYIHKTSKAKTLKIQNRLLVDLFLNPSTTQKTAVRLSLPSTQHQSPSSIQNRFPFPIRLRHSIRDFPQSGIGFHFRFGFQSSVLQLAHIQIFLTPVNYVSKNGVNTCPPVSGHITDLF